MIIVRSIEKKDLNGFYKLAGILDTYNLPKNRPELSKIIELSCASFRGSLKDKQLARYVFVAEDTQKKRIIGTSEIVARRGRKGFPFISFQVGIDRKESSTLHTVCRHPYLKLDASEKGATEIGGLVVDPEWRGRSGVGKLLSFVRFIYMKAHPGLFHKLVRAELLAYLTPEGENPLWNVLGKHFTGMDYREADHLSAYNKEFILSLFPSSKIYTCLLPERIRSILAKAGPQTIPAQKLLESIGFRYLNQIDPFDGGPLFGARRNRISIYRKAEHLQVDLLHEEKGFRSIVMSQDQSGTVRALWGLGKRLKKRILLSQETITGLGLNKDMCVWTCRMNSFA